MRHTQYIRTVYADPASTNMTSTSTLVATTIPFRVADSLTPNSCNSESAHSIALEKHPTSVVAAHLDGHREQHDQDSG
jgi:hypothetical protein